MRVDDDKVDSLKVQQECLQTKCVLLHAPTTPFNTTNTRDTTTQPYSHSLRVYPLHVSDEI